MENEWEVGAPGAFGPGAEPRAANRAVRRPLGPNPAPAGPGLGPEARKWVCAWGAAKLPVPRSSRFRQEPEDAVWGRHSGPIDPRAAAGDGR